MNLKKTVPIRIETGLFELLSWQSYLPNKYPFMNMNSLIKNGYNIDKNYNPVVPYHTIKSNENEELFYKRSHFMTQTIVDSHDNNGK